MNKELIRTWADTIWQILCEKGRLSVEDLTKSTGLETEAVYTAIGWLASEGNISFEKDGKGVSVYIFHELYY